MKFKEFCFPAVLLAAFSLTGCGGTGGADNPDGSAAITKSSPLVLSGWYSCNVSNSGSILATASSGAVLATPHGALYGSCSTASGNAANVNVSASYAGTSGVMPDFNNALVLQATLTNLLFYPFVQSNVGLPATNEAGTLLPSDTYASAPPSQSFNTNSGNSVDFQFTETGSTSQSGAASSFTVPKSFYLSGSTTYLQPQSGAPASVSNFQGSYVTATSDTWNSTLNAVVPQTIPGVLGSGSSLTVDAQGNLSGTTPAGTLSGTVSSYDATTGTAEYTGTLTTSAGATAVQGAYAWGTYPLATYAQNAQGPFDASAMTSYTPLALFIKGNGFMYEVLLQKSN
jgi:hypothetical protein